jgi:hypothetical protein
MRNQRRAFWLATVALVASSVWVAGSVAAADAGGKFYRANKGKLFVSEKPFEATEDEDAMAAQVKKQSRTELKATGGNEDGASWDFHWVAVLSKKPGSANATILFYDVSGKERKQATYKDIGCDPNQTIIVSDLSISEDDGLKKGNKYEIVLAADQGGKQVPLAKGTVTFK